MNILKIGDLKFKYDDDCVIIENSCLEDKEHMMYWYLRKFLKITGYKSKRTLDSWICEWKTHNFFYKLGLFRSHCINCDLEENENKFRLFVYAIIGNIF